MAKPKSYEIGDKVKLNTGGPDMTVQATATTPTGVYTCQWFAGKKLDSGRFPFASLVPVEKTPDPKP